MDGVLVTGAFHLNEEGGLAVEADELFVFIEALDDGGDIGKAEAVAIAGGDDDIFKSFAGECLPVGSEHDVPIFCPHRACGKAEGGSPDGLTEILESESVVAEFAVIRLDGKFHRAFAEDLCERDFGEVQELIADVLRGEEEFRLGEIPGDGHGDDLEPEIGVGENVVWFFRLGREGTDTLDAGFHFFQEFLQIGAIGGVDLDGSRAAAGGGFDPLDAGKLLDGTLDGEDDKSFNILRVSATVGDLDPEAVQLDAGADFERDLEEGGINAGKQDRHHEEVGGDVVVREPADHGGNVR